MQTNSNTRFVSVLYATCITIVILVFVQTVVIGNARYTKREHECAGRLEQIGQALRLYAQDYDDYLPVGQEADMWGTWVRKCEPYSQSVGVFRCGNDTTEMLPLMQPHSTGTSWAGIRISYGANGWMRREGGRWTVRGVMGLHIEGVDCPAQALNAIRSPEATILVTEKHHPGNMSDWGPGCVFTGVHAWDWLAPSVIPDGSRATEKAGAVTATHGGLANVLMVDGHVKSMRPEATDPNPSGHPDENMWDASR